MVERQDSETPELDGPSAERGVQASGLILAPWERVDRCRDALLKGWV